MNRNEYVEGQLINGIKFIKELTHRLMPNGYNERRGLFLCKCGNEFEASISGVKYGKPKSCGCLRIKKLREATGYHGLKGTKYYRAWCNIKNRCYNKNSKDYEFYGARGIILSNEFLHDPVSFCSYISSLNNSGKNGYSIDRIDNNGNYERNNIRWASMHTQSINKRKQKNNSSGFIGIVKNVGKKCSGKYISSITNKGVKNYIGMYDTAKEAAIARNEFIIKNKLPHKLNII